MTEQHLMPNAVGTASDETIAGRPAVCILNPASRRGRHLRATVERALADGRAELALTDAPGAAERIAAEAAIAGRGVVVVGGDGTVAEAANGILACGARVPLGVVPAGNGNDYALRALKLPKDPARALEIALAGNPRAMDVGQVNGRYFVNVLGVGIDANIAAAAERMKRLRLLRGQALYYTASLRELLFFYSRCPELTVTCDGQPGERRLYALAAVSIGPSYGGGFAINPQADPTDGLFDVCAIWKPSRLRALRLLTLVQKGRHLGKREVAHVHAHTVTLEAAQPIYAHLDGEVIRGQRFEARILPEALLVRQP